MKIILPILAVIAAVQGRGLNGLGSRIVNGTVAKLGEIPFQASLQQARWAFCGGSVINEYYVLTAAHCLASYNAENVEVIVGTIYWQKPGQVHQAEKLISHENYDPTDSYFNDIGLVKVVTPFEFSDVLQPVPLPEPYEKVATNGVATVSGWGRLGGNEMVKPDILYKADILVADEDYCRNVMKEQSMNIYATHLCANDPSTRKGQCSGDSGGPLVVDGKLAGVVSWSIKDPYCASTKYPGIYTRVSAYVGWISENAI